MSLTWTFTGGAPEPHNELAGQTMIILCPRGESPLTYMPAIAGRLSLGAAVTRRADC